MHIVEAEPGQNVADFAAELVTIAWRTNDVVLGEFNQHTLEARPGMTREDVMRPWNNAQRESYLNR